MREECLLCCLTLLLCLFDLPSDLAIKLGVLQLLTEVQANNKVRVILKTDPHVSHYHVLCVCRTSV